ncbi:regulator of chromosome condensation 1/beta-lactamase-inhibitor protein II [Halenospora varia]|nr:regulator of chromosome condensation 1/beta-lactamase-inhibitor protein II [Halenospora varia]
MSRVDNYELWASGLNAFGQIDFATQHNSEPLPKDWKTFQRTLISSQDDIQVVHSSFSATLIRRGSEELVRGDPCTFMKQLMLSSRCRNSPDHIAIASNDKVAAAEKNAADDTDTDLCTYSSLHGYRARQHQTSVQGPIIQKVVANRTSFHALTINGNVLSWGDSRYEACMGRSHGDGRPLDSPSIIDDLIGLPTGPIRKIASGGFLTAAITAGDDLYVWGHHLKQGPVEMKLYDEVTGNPSSVDVNGYDILDVAVGEGYALVLTKDPRKLFVIGSNSNGQLGIGDSWNANDWTEVVLPLGCGQKMVAVYAGYKNSFVLVEKNTK